MKLCPCGSGPLSEPSGNSIPYACLAYNINVASDMQTCPYRGAAAIDPDARQAVPFHERKQALEEADPVGKMCVECGDDIVEGEACWDNGSNCLAYLCDECVDGTFALGISTEMTY